MTAAWRVKAAVAVGVGLALALTWQLGPSRDAGQGHAGSARGRRGAAEATGAVPVLSGAQGAFADGGDAAARAVDADPLGGSHRIVLATIPRSGNGWIRGMLEASTRVATASVYPEQGATFSDDVDAFSADCGWLADCGLVHAATANPVVIKTHYPFLESVLGANVTRPQPPDGVGVTAADVNGTVVYAISPVRNPLDNYDAWRRYCTKRGNQSHDPHRDVRDFVDAWAAHHAYWQGARVPVTVYRYEDLVENPVSVLVKTLHASGLWERCGIRDIDLLHVANISSLSSYKRKQMGSTTRKKDDIWHAFTRYDAADVEYTLKRHRALLARFGYDGLYRVWLDALRNNRTSVEPVYHRKDGAGASLPPLSLHEPWDVGVPDRGVPLWGDAPPSRR